MPLPSRSSLIRTPDGYLLWSVVALTLFGFLIFSSASLGLLGKPGSGFGGIAGKQFFAVALGGVLALILSHIHYRSLRRFALAGFALSLVLTLLVFVPGIGVSHGGANRWLPIFGLSFQPAELLKIAVVFYYASFLAAVRREIKTAIFGFLPLLVLSVITGGLLLAQPDTDTFFIIFLTLVTLFLAAGGKMRDILIMILIGAIGLSALVSIRPYLKERVMTFLQPENADARGARYQLDQSLIAIGSGGWFGRGFGQSVQKFSYLPEPIGDSVFAVAAEEFGFIGVVFLIGLFLAFILRGLRVAARAPDFFGGLLALGIVILIGTGAFMNMASMLGIIPLSGLPLSFVSHGGTALVITLAATGVLLNISRYQKGV